MVEVELTDVDFKTEARFEGLDYHALNAMLNLYDADGKIQFDADKRAAREYFLQHVNQNTVFFHSLKERLDYLVEKVVIESDPLLAEALASPAEKASELFGQLGQIMAKEHVILPILSPDAVFVHRKGISGVRLSACCNLVLADIKAE